MNDGARSAFFEQAGVFFMCLSPFRASIAAAATPLGQKPRGSHYRREDILLCDY
jgi:hypothetical protein